jgi:anti-anti-sigma factor
MRPDPAFLLDLTMDGAYAVVRAEGELDIAAVPGLQGAIRHAANRSPRVVADLRRVEFMDSFALAALVALQRESDGSHWTLHCIAGQGIQRLLDLARARRALRWIAPEQLTNA